jgi:hypothetical protein
MIELRVKTEKRDYDIQHTYREGKKKVVGIIEAHLT